jgi:hypothetical protein
VAVSDRAEELEHATDPSVTIASTATSATLRRPGGRGLVRGSTVVISDRS